VIVAFNISLNEAHVSKPGHVPPDLGIIYVHLLDNVRDPHRFLLEKEENSMPVLVRDLEEKFIESL